MMGNLNKIEFIQYYPGELQRITVENNEKVVELVESDKKVTIQYKDSPDHKEIITLDAPSYIIRAGRSAVLLRFVAETFGCEVEWEPIEQRILISWDL